MLEIYADCYRYKQEFVWVTNVLAVQEKFFFTRGPIVHNNFANPTKQRLLT